jgi:benzoyl-CoA reductase/2-hydroxyglutaryl-CoA dehydratase subunit BcrC/BadD/HgdB
MEEAGYKKLEDMVHILRGILKHRKDQPTAESEELYYESLLSYCNGILEAKDKGKMLVGHSVMFPVELLYAFDLVPLNLETLSGTQTILTQSFSDTLSAAAQYGLPQEVCSTYRVLMGSVVSQSLPKPDFIVWSSHVCDNTARTWDILTEHYQIPGFFLDRPFRRSEKEETYLIKELKRLISFIEEQTKTKFDYDRFKEIMQNSIRAMELCHEVYNLRKGIPSPFRNRTIVNSMTMEWILSGTAEATAYFETVRNEVRALAQMDPTKKAKEKYRLLCLYLPPLYDLKFLDWLKRDYGASVVMDLLTIWQLEPDLVAEKPLEALVKKIFLRPDARLSHGPGEILVDEIVSRAKEFHLDGAIFFAHIGCRQSGAMIRSLKDGLQKELGLPYSVIDMDTMDPSFTTIPEIKNKIEGFFEMLDAYK